MWRCAALCAARATAWLPLVDVLVAARGAKRQEWRLGPAHCFSGGDFDKWFHKSWTNLAIGFRRETTLRTVYIVLYPRTSAARDCRSSRDAHHLAFFHDARGLLEPLLE